MGPPRIVVLTEDPTQQSVLEHVLHREGYQVSCHGEEASLRSAVVFDRPDAILLDLGMAREGSGPLLQWIRASHPGTPLLLLDDGEGIPEAAPGRAGDLPAALAPREPGPRLVLSIRTALEASRLGRRVRSLERVVDGGPWRGLVGRSPALRSLQDEIDRIAPSEVMVWIRGEPGVGKSLVARTLHDHGARRGPLVSEDLATRGARGPETLFGGGGVEEGSATGALERARGGTLVLRGLATLPARDRVALLDVFETGRYTPVDGGASRPVDVRWIVIQGPGSGESGEDAEGTGPRPGVEVRVPPLRERREDIPLLVDHFLHALAPARPPARVTPEALEALLTHPWPGNVRELRDAVQRGAGVGRGEIGVDELPQAVVRAAKDLPGEAQDPLPRTLDLGELERWAVGRAVAEAGGNLTAAAERLGIGRTTLYRKLRIYGMR